MKTRILREDGRFEDWDDKKHGKLPKPAQIRRQDIVVAERKQHEAACLKGGFSPDNPSDRHPGTLYAEDKILIRAGMLVPDLMYLAKARKVKLHPDLDSKEAIEKCILACQTYVVEAGSVDLDTAFKTAQVTNINALTDVAAVVDADLENAEDSPDIVDPRLAPVAKAPIHADGTGVAPVAKAPIHADGTGVAPVGVALPTQSLSEAQKAEVVEGKVTITVMKHLAKGLGLEVPKGIISKAKMTEILLGPQESDPSGL